MLGVAEVHDLEVVVGVQHHVLKLEIPVEHTVLVHVLHSINHLKHHKTITAINHSDVTTTSVQREANE